LLGGTGQTVSLHWGCRRAACKLPTAFSDRSGGSGSTRRHGRPARVLSSIDARVLSSVSITEAYPIQKKCVTLLRAPTTMPLAHHRTPTLSEDKRCMLVPAKLVADFSGGCAGKRIAHSLFATHPHRYSIRESPLRYTPCPYHRVRSMRDDIRIAE